MSKTIAAPDKTERSGDKRTITGTDTPGGKHAADVILNAPYKNSADTVKKTVTTTATKLNTPDGARNFFIFHKTPGAVVSIGDKSVDTSDYIDVPYGVALHVKDFRKENGNELYARVASSTLVVYASGAVAI